MVEAPCLSGVPATIFRMRYNFTFGNKFLVSYQPFIFTFSLQHKFALLNNLPGFHQQIWRWQRTGRIYLAGETALVTGLVMWMTSLPQIRRKKFELFYYTHHLYIIFLIFFLFHAGDRHFYMVFGGIFLFGLDKLLRIIQSRPQSCILSARVFSSKAMELILPKDPSNISSYSFHINNYTITFSSSTSFLLRGFPTQMQA